MASTHQQRAGAMRAPMFITQQRKVRDFLADQNRLATIKSDWLYQLGSTDAKERLLRDHGFTPLREDFYRPALPA